MSSRLCLEAAGDASGGSVVLPAFLSASSSLACASLKAVCSLLHFGFVLRGLVLRQGQIRLELRHFIDLIRGDRGFLAGKLLLIGVDGLLVGFFPALVFLDDAKRFLVAPLEELQEFFLSILEVDEAQTVIGGFVLYASGIIPYDGKEYSFGLLKPPELEHAFGRPKQGRGVEVARRIGVDENLEIFEGALDNPAGEKRCGPAGIGRPARGAMCGYDDRNIPMERSAFS